MGNLGPSGGLLRQNNVLNRYGSRPGPLCRIPPLAGRQPGLLFACATSRSHLGYPVCSLHLLIHGSGRREQVERGAGESTPAVHTGTAGHRRDCHLPLCPGQLQINLLKGDGSSLAPRQELFTNRSLGQTPSVFLSAFPQM